MDIEKKKKCFYFFLPNIFTEFVKRTVRFGRIRYISCFRCTFQKVRANLPMTPNTVARSCVRRRTSTRRRASLRATPASCCHLVAPTRSRAKSRQMPEPSTSTGIRSQRLAKVCRLIYTIILLIVYLINYLFMYLFTYVYVCM